MQNAWVGNWPKSTDAWINSVPCGLGGLRQLGATIDFEPTAGTAVIDTTQMTSTELPPEMASRMRASLLSVGPLLARFGTATLDEVGGCNIGERNTESPLKLPSIECSGSDRSHLSK